MKPRDKIILSILILIMSAACVALFFIVQKPVVLTIYDPITQSHELVKVDKGKTINEADFSSEKEGFRFVGFYYDSLFENKFDSNQKVYQNATLIKAYNQTISSENQIIEMIYGIKVSGQLDNQLLTTILNSKYKYLDLSSATTSQIVQPENTYISNAYLKELILPTGTVSSINNFSKLEIVKTVGETKIINCFNNCEKLKTVSLAGTVEILDSFDYCKNLSTFEIPSSLTNIEDCFYETNIDVLTNNSSNFFIENNVLYQKQDETVILKKALSDATAVIVNLNTSKIDDYAFYDCKYLTVVSIDAKVEEIGEGCFENSSVSQVNISQNTILTIKNKAFKNCKNLTDVSLGKGVETIEEQSFYGSAIKNISFAESVLSTIGNYAFADCENLEKVDFSTREITLGIGVFSACKNLTQISNINVENLPTKTFSNCEKLVSVTGLDNLLSIENYVFENCKGLTSISFLDQITSAGVGSFYGCQQIEEAKFWNLKTISEFMFEKCSSLETVISNGAIEIFKPSAFDYCEKLSSISFAGTNFVVENNVVYNSSKTELLYYLPTKTETSFTILSSVEKINNRYLSAANNLEEIKSNSSNFVCEDGILFSKDKTTLLSYPRAKEDTTFTIPENVSIIESYSFVGCENLNSLSMIDSVKQINFAALWQIKSLTSLKLNFIGESLNKKQTSFLGWIFGSVDYTQNNYYVPKSITTVSVVQQEDINLYSFYGCEHILTINLENVENIGEYAFFNCSKLQVISMLSEVKTIGSYAFYLCESLTNINIVYSDELIVGEYAVSKTPKGVEVDVDFIGEIDPDKFEAYKAKFVGKITDWDWDSV